MHCAQLGGISERWGPTQLLRGRAAAPELRLPDLETPKHVRYMSGHLFSVPVK